MNILLLCRYAGLGASSRVRFGQYLPHLEAAGWKVDVAPFFSDEYLQALYRGKPRTVEAVRGYWHRLLSLFRANRYSVLWIEKEVFPFMPAFAERLLNLAGIRFVVDYDDAMFHRYDQHQSFLVRTLLGKKIDAVMRHATLVVAGNNYLANHARAAAARQVAIVPTVVDLNRYQVAPASKSHSPVIGWIGSPATSHYLSGIAPVCRTLCADTNAKFVAVGASKEGLNGVPIEVREWSEDSEVSSIQAFDIGIMPLTDSPWERGKCGYKLVQYMACGLPVVASPVGANREIVEHGVNGFIASTASEWEQALRMLLKNDSLRKSMGAKGRESIEAKYSLQVQAPRLQSLLREMLS